ncbi:MAG TPA: AAA family ATPase [Acidimicrobiales bacterium]|nr:AAA family ATPase [Acidimicrobiales bacterium]
MTTMNQSAPDEGRVAPKVVETHTAILFFVGEHVYKLKKAVDLGFLDHRDREARRACCKREVELNRRLAPDVYHGVLDLIDEAGRPVDHVVDMRRMPDDRRLSRCIERDEDVEPPLRAAAHVLAALHAHGKADPVHDAEATRDAVLRRWRDGFDQVRTLPVGPSAEEGMARMEDLAVRYLSGRAPLFDERIRRGWIRDGHGDLQAEDIFLLEDGPRILDCLEFGDEYRWGDVLSDVAFLAMDLERLGRPQLAQLFLGLHRQLCADTWPATLADHYIAYRAHVRAKVEILRSVQHADRSAASAGPYIDLANRHLEDAQVRLVVVGGEPGTGKSTLAERLGDRLGAVVLRTDEIRQRMAHPVEIDRYAPEAVTAAYVEMLIEARRLVGLGEHVILDATWTSQAHRSMARSAAAECAADLIELRCTLPRLVADERIRRRQSEGTDASEATVEVATLLAARFERWPEATEVPTQGSPEDVADLAAATILRLSRR